MVDYKKVEEFWDRQAEEDPDQAGILGTRGPTAARFRADAEWRSFLRLVPPQKNWDILELGCGAGRWCFRLAPRVRFVRGVDLSREMIKLAAAEKIKHRMENVSFQKASLLDFSPPETYDLIYFSGVLNHIHDAEIEPLLQRLLPALKPGGRILSRDSVRPEGRKVMTGEYPIIYRTLAEYSAPFQTAGFKLTSYQESFLWPRAEERFARLFSRDFQRGHPRLSMAGFVGLEYLARFLVQAGYLQPLSPRELLHLFMLFERA